MGNYKSYINGKWIDSPTFDECLELVKKKHDTQKKAIDALRKQLEDIKEEKWKDRELLRMQTKIDELNKIIQNSFTVSEDEERRINDWMKAHHDDVREPLRKLPSHCISKYVFVPTEVGDFGTVYCRCGKYFEFKTAE